MDSVIPLLFKPEDVDDNTWSKLLNKLEETSSNELVDHDICLIGSHARGDASSLSDIDLVLYAEGDSNLKHTELFYVDQKMVTIFSVNVTDVLRSESVDFYNANNPFEARLVYGSGKVLNTFKDGLIGKKIDKDETKKIIGTTLSNRLSAALRDVIGDYGEGIRNMRACPVKLRVYSKIFEEEVDPWSLIPSRYTPEGELENLINELYNSKNNEDLSLKLEKLDLKDIIEKTFEKDLETILKVAEKMENEIGFAGKNIMGYFGIYLMVEEKVRSILWERLPKRWRIGEIKPEVRHSKTKIVCKNQTVWWRVSIGEAESPKIENFGKTEF